MGIIFYDCVYEFEGLLSVAITGEGKRVSVYFRLGFVEDKVIDIIVPDFWIFSIGFS